ncbi:hypothetical protein CL652_02740 [bacterium]|nr:hypothetical protein [bacterium]|tara:strand:+ start:25863 stop:26456 length:594 start_codon:yes stop_codon:yes gene_type:complete
MLILDVEASGTEYDKHSIISLGALDFRNPTNRFYEECRIWDGAHIMEGAREVHGLSDKDITDTKKQTEAQLIEKFLVWAEMLEDRTLGGQNVSFDRDFVKAAVERAGLNYSFAYRTVDSHSLAWMHMIRRGLEPPIDSEHKRSALNLDSILNYCGIPEEPKPHNALTGAISHAEVIHRLLYEKKFLPEFEKYNIPWK